MPKKNKPQCENPNKSAYDATMRENLAQKDKFGDLVADMVSNMDMGDFGVTAQRNIAKMAQDRFRRLAAGGLDDPKLDYGDGDQTEVKNFAEEQVLRCMWGSGGDYSPTTPNPTISNWCRACFSGNPLLIKRQLDQFGPKLLDKRDSVLRVPPITNVIAGARSMNPMLPKEIHVTVTEGTNFPEALRLLIKAGANINAKDYAGYTPLHHATGQYATDLTRELALILLKAGAGVNLKNRLGCSALLEPTMVGNEDSIKLLLEHGADASMKDYQGTSLMELASQRPRLMKIFSDHISKTCVKEKKDLISAGLHRYCKVCKRDENCSRCKACLSVWYCGRECQRSDWKDHKQECASVKDGYMLAKLKDNDKMFNYNSDAAKFKTSPNESKSHFVVKVQASIGDPDGFLMVYNRERSYMGQLFKDSPLHHPLRETLSSKGVMGGVKGYFSAMVKQGKLFINPHQIETPEAW